MRRILLLAVAVLALAVGVAGRAGASPPLLAVISGNITKKTGGPAAGIQVIANCYGPHGTPYHNIGETTTDATGHYFFNVWATSDIPDQPPCQLGWTVFVSADDNGNRVFESYKVAILHTGTVVNFTLDDNTNIVVPEYSGAGALAAIATGMILIFRIRMRNLD